MLKKAISILITLAFIISIVPSNTAQALTTKTPEQVKNYAIYYGQPETEKINQLKKFDLVVIDPDNFTAEQVKTIKESGTIVLGYQDTLVVNKTNPQLPGLQSGDYLTVNGKRVETTSGSTVQSFLDPRSAHLWEVLKKEINTRIYNKGLDGVFLEGINYSEFLGEYVTLDANALRSLQLDLYAGTKNMLNQIKAMNSAKYVAQNNGWRELKSHTGQYIDFLFWSGYQDELGNSNEWLNNRRDEVLSLKNQYGVVPLAYKVISPENTAGMKQFYSTVKSQGLIPYAIPGVSTEINTYDLPVTPPDNPAPNPGMPHAINSFVINLGVSDQHLEAMKKFDLAIVGPEISDYQLKELQSAGVQVIAYMATTSIDQQYPYYQGLTEEDYLWVNGKKVANGNDYLPDWLMDPRSAHFRKIVVDTIKKDIFDRGFDGVYLDTLNQAAEYIEFYVSLDPTSMAKLKSELMAGSAQLAKEIRAAGPNKILAHNNGWRELINYTAPYIDYIMWEGYQYELGTTDEWLNQKRNNLINLSKEHDFTVLACRFFDYNDFAGVQEFYDAARSYGFIPYSPWKTNGQLWYNNVNTYGVPPRTPIPEQPPVEDPGEEEPPVDEENPPVDEEEPPVNEENPPTDEEPAPDTERPSSPKITTATAVNSNSIKLSWQKSTDNVGVDHYKIYRLDSTKGFIEHATTTDTTFTDTNLSKKTVYYYYVVAVDAAGNQSLITEVKSVQTKK